MGTRLRPWTTYKAFGGVLAVLGLPASILVALGDTPPGGGPAAPLTAAARPGLLGLAGLYVFLASDRAVKRSNRLKLPGFGIAQVDGRGIKSDNTL